VRFGRRAVDAELQGIPIRIEVGPRDLATGNVTIARRVDGSKTPTAIGEVVGAVTSALQADQQRLYDEAVAFRTANTVEVKTLGDAIEAAQTGWARVPWSAVGEDGEAEANGKAVTVRCLVREDGSMPDSDDEAGLVAILARSY
jgi:prolyl-tRNA synthetase